MPDAEDGQVVARDGSKLAIDDPNYCKECGAELPEGWYGAEDDDGAPLAYYDGEWHRIERCKDCWAHEQLRQLLSESMERFDGEIPEVLPRVI